MWRKRGKPDIDVLLDANKELVEMTKQALDWATESRAFTNEILETTKQAVATTAGVVALAESFAERLRLSDRLRTMEPGEPLGADELQTFADVAPQWNVFGGIIHGQAVKVYQRTIGAEELVPERRGEGEKEHETYLSLADVEHSDFNLANIFGTYSFSGDYMNGEYYVIKIYSPEAGPVTYDDFAKVLDAEEYLVNAGYILPPSGVMAGLEV